MAIAKTLQQYVQDNGLSWPDIKTITDEELVEICPGISLTALRNHMEILIQESLNTFMSDQVAAFVQNTVEANQEFIREYPNWDYEANAAAGTLTIYWNGKSEVQENQE